MQVVWLSWAWKARCSPGTAEPTPVQQDLQWRRATWTKPKPCHWAASNSKDSFTGKARPGFSQPGWLQRTHNSSDWESAIFQGQKDAEEKGEKTQASPSAHSDHLLSSKWRKDMFLNQPFPHHSPSQSTPAVLCCSLHLQPCPALPVCAPARPLEACCCPLFQGKPWNTEGSMQTSALFLSLTQHLIASQVTKLLWASLSTTWKGVQCPSHLKHSCEDKSWKQQILC